MDSYSQDCNTRLAVLYLCLNWNPQFVTGVCNNIFDNMNCNTTMIFVIADIDTDEDSVSMYGCIVSVVLFVLQIHLTR